MTRDEHMEWCKQRALELLDSGDLQGAVISMLSDLGKHPDNKNMMEMAGVLGLGVLMGSPTVDSVKRFIDGFHMGE